jgi:hypothetical protein
MHKWFAVDMFADVLMNAVHGVALPCWEEAGIEWLAADNEYCAKYEGSVKGQETDASAGFRAASSSVTSTEAEGGGAGIAE